MHPDAISLGQSVAGGVLIGLGAALLILLNGQVAGISGIVSRVLRLQGGERGWRLWFLIGLVLPAAFFGTGPVEWPTTTSGLLVAGLLVGLGTRLGSGCTSGHGVCGIANLSLRSVAATATFISAAMLTVLIKHFLSRT
jgi:uncharacterized membrane protein YedE/YeeE